MALRIVCVGGGPAGLYFALLAKRRDPARDVVVLERNAAGETYGFGVVFSDATLAGLAAEDADTYADLMAALTRWDAIEIHARGTVLRTTGHGFAGLSRHWLLAILEARCRAVGVRLEFEREAADLAPWMDRDLVVCADGVTSAGRARLADRFGTSVEWGANRFVWLGTTYPFRAFTFFFKSDRHGLWRAHAYPYSAAASTFIVETTEAAWRRAGLDAADEAQTIAFVERLFADELAGHRVLASRSLWRAFPTVRNRSWHAGRVVLLGDAAHTAHFSVGSGTRLALADAAALAQALDRGPDVPAALAAYEAERRPEVEALQRAARASSDWFEAAERYWEDTDALEFAASLLTRSLRVNHAELRRRDPALVARIDARVAERAAAQAECRPPVGRVPPPMFTPFRLRDLVFENRVVVSPMCQYSAMDGTPGEWHLVNLGARAIGGAGLVIAEMTDVTRDGRITPGCAGMYEAAHVPAWRRITDFVHAHSRARIALQLAHAGRKGATCRPWEGGYDEPLPDGAWPLVSASPIPFDARNQVPAELTPDGMAELEAAFARAAAMAETAGFDMLELHMAHGYLLASFLSPLTNRRTDGFGGSLEARLRFPLSVLRAVRAAWPEGKPISVKISATDWAPGGLTGDEAVEIARALGRDGCDLVTVSTGQTVADQAPVHGRLWQTPFSDRIRHEARVPTMAVGNIASWADVNTIISAGRADLCALARGHLFDPNWTRHAAWEQGWALGWPPQYEAASTFTPRESR